MRSMNKKPRGCQGCGGFSWDGYMPKPEGPAHAKVLLVGEALGAQEAEAGKPFVGKAGAWLTSLLRRHGVERETLLLDNVLRCRPTDNKIHHAEVNGAINYCPTQSGHLNESAARKDVKVIVAMGATATRHFLGLRPGTPLTPYLGYPAWSFEYGKWVIPTYHPAFLFRGNQNLSGVFAQYVRKGVDLAEGRFTPAPFPSTLSDPTLAQLEAWVRGYEERLASGAPTWLAFDIETPYKASEDEGDLIMDDPTFTILRIGFAYQGSSGLSLAWRADYLPMIQRLLASRGVKLVWNGRYDCPRLAANGVAIHGDIWDGMLAWHVINSDLPKGLGFVAPLLTNHPRWKHLSGDDPGKYNAMDAVVTVSLCEKIVEDLHAANMWPVFERHIVQVDRVLDGINRTGILFDQEKRYEVSIKLQQELEKLRVGISNVVPQGAKAIHPKGGFAKTPKVTEGMATIPSTEKVRYCAYCGERSPKKAHFAKCGKPQDWNTRKHGKWPEKGVTYREETEETVRYARILPFVPSNLRMMAYLREMKHKGVIAADKKTGKKRLTFDDKALKALMVSYPSDPLYPLVLKYRKAEKQLGYVGVRNPLTGEWKGGMPVGKDGRVHTTISHNPSTLRFSSIAPNLQNQPRDGEIRSLFIADPGFTLWEADYSAIEARLVAYFARSPIYDRLARLGVHDYLNAQILRQQGMISDEVNLETQSDADLKRFFKDLKKRFNEMREVAKRVVHGSNYGMGPREMYRNYPEVFGSEKKASLLQGIYFDACPMIPRWQEETVTRAEEEAELRNPFSYLHRFWNVCEYKQMPDGEWVRKWGLDAKRALAFMPQGTAAGVIKEAMLSLEEELEMSSREWLLLQVHDSLLFRLPTAEVDEWGAKITEIMERPVKALPLPWDGAKHLQIFTEAKMGPRWGKTMTEWRRG